MENVENTVPDDGTQANFSGIETFADLARPDGETPRASESLPIRDSTSPVATTVATPTLWDSPWIPWAIVGVALILRVLWLGMKPPHFDEGVNGWFVDQMTKQGLSLIHI